MVAKYLELQAHCSDCFFGVLFDANKNELDNTNGYVPGGLGIGGGDDVSLTIDLETGQIVNWVPIHISSFDKEE